MTGVEAGNDGKAPAGINLPDRTSATLFLEDTVEVQLTGGEPIVGVVTKTWHDLDEQDIWDEIEETVPGDKASLADLRTFVRTGQPPRQFYCFAPSSPDNLPILVHESECTLLDRAFAFGDVVKRSLTDPQSGTIVSIETQVTLRPSFLDTTAGHEAAEIVGVAEAELSLVNDWNIGDFVIYKNCWMGVVDDVYEEITIRLPNGSVVVVYDPFDLEIALVTPAELALARGSSESVLPVSDSFPTTSPAQQPIKRGSAAGKPKSVVLSAQISPGQTVVTTKANLWKGRWIYGAYDPAVRPLGVVVDVKTQHFEVNWLCQNMMVTGRFVPVERPPTRVMWEDEVANICKFKKSSGGFVDIQGNPFKDASEFTSGGDLQVGDRVRFTDLDAAVQKYKGAVRRIPRSEVLGFDVNTFMVVATSTKARVLWQDMTETVNNSKTLVPYLNVDEHEVWPGEIVIVKPDTSATSQSKPVSDVSQATTRERFEGVWEAWHSATGHIVGAEEKPEFMRPEKVGVVQSVNPADRVASVRWFASPNVDVAGGIMIPGSTTGPLQPMAEDVSLYDAVAHQALGVRRGDFVLVAPERLQDEQPHVEQAGSSASPSEAVAAFASPPPPTDIEMAQVAQFVDSIRGLVDGGLLSNLSAALGNHSNPQLQAVSRVLNQFPGLLNPGLHPALPLPGARNPHAPTANANAFADQPPEWLGEVMDLGLDGLVTVRLGALKEPRDVRVPIERLHIIFNEDMELDAEYDDEDEYDTDEESGSDDDDGMDYVGMDEPEVIEEKIEYEGGARLDNGGEEDWLTDDEGGDDDSDEDIPDLVPAVAPVPTQAESDPQLPTAGTNTEPLPLTPPPIPENVPAPEAIRLAPGAPPRFLVLDTPIPSDHAYKNQPATVRAPTVARRIAKEQKILSSSLPEGIFVRTWESRLDLLRVLIVGPLNTPYELAPFIFDFHFTSQFPVHPPVGYFHSWTGGIGRVNPNLYEDGKICLSLLGTWHAERRGEGWSAAGSSVLQLLVSLMGLVLVREPWYNEAGFGVYQGAEEAALNSQLYSEKAYILARGFVKHVLQRPVQGFENVIEWLYLPHRPNAHQDEDREELGPGPFLLKDVVEKARDVVTRSESGQAIAVENTTDGVGRVSRGALALLKRHLGVLEGILEDKTGTGADTMEGVEYQ